jgi:hypothetical protein
LEKERKKERKKGNKHHLRHLSFHDLFYIVNFLKAKQRRGQRPPFVPLILHYHHLTGKGPASSISDPELWKPDGTLDFSDRNQPRLRIPQPVLLSPASHNLTLRLDHIKFLAVYLFPD